MPSNEDRGPRTREEENSERSQWSNKADYLLSLGGLAVGLGNVWRFPYLCYKNGGGAFLIPYVIMLVFVGMPMFLLETSMGQFTSSTILNTYEICPALRGVGFAALLATGVATMYYSVLMAYPLIFIWESLTTGPLPWATCDNYWNTPRCSTMDESVNNISSYDYDSGYTNFSSYDNYDSGYRNYSDDRFLTDNRSVSSSEEFFHNKVVQLSPAIEDLGGPVLGVNIANIIVWIVMFLIIFKGVKIMGKVVWFTALFPYVILMVLLIRGSTLPGASIGIRAYLTPQFYRLLSMDVWVDAGSQIFYSLGTGWGSLFCLGSYNKYRNNTPQDALVVPIINALTSFMAGLVVFSVLGFMSETTGKPIDEVASAGIDLAFITYPQALAMMPGAQFWSIAFFFMIFLLGIDSCFVQVELIVASVTDYFPRLRKRKAFVALATCLIIHQGSLLMCTRAGIYWLVLLDSSIVTHVIILVGLLEVSVFSLSYGPGRLIRDIQVMTGQRVGRFTWFTWMYSCPIILLLLFLYLVLTAGHISYDHYIFPDVIQTVGTSLTIAATMVVPLYWIVYMVTAKGSFSKRMSQGHSQTPNWGPRLEEHRAEWLSYCSQFLPTFLARYSLPTVPVPDYKNHAIETLELDRRATRPRSAGNSTSGASGRVDKDPSSSAAGGAYGKLYPPSPSADLEGRDGSDAGNDGGENTAGGGV